MKRQTKNENETHEVGDIVRIVSKKTGKAWEAKGKDIILTSPRDSLKQLWILEGTPTGDFILENVAYEGKVLDTSMTSKTMVIWEKNCQDNQKLNLHPDGTITSPHYTGHYVEIIDHKIQLRSIEESHKGDVVFDFQSIDDTSHFY
ncbi:hypothetical protein JTB14_004537 [Gonioctena quinquepunctata]|nr:hypothetical protein JTB14_004537 [Gonioctena quinquepunctata]